MPCATWEFWSLDERQLPITSLFWLLWSNCLPSSMTSSSFLLNNSELKCEQGHEDDEERLSMKISDMPPPLPGRVSNLRIRDDQALNEFCSDSDKMHRAASDGVNTQAWFDFQSIIDLSTICEKIGKDVELFNVSTYQCSIIFNNLRSFNRKSEFWKPENQNKPITKSEQINIAELSLLNEFLWKQPCPCYLDVRGGQFADRHKAVAWKLWLGGMPLSQKPWPVSPCENWLHRLCWPSLGINRKSNWVFLCVDCWGKNWSETRKSTRRFARANSWYAFLWPWNCCISRWR